MRAIAIDTSMRIFFVIIVLVVSLAFLLRAFNIDPFKFIQDMFGVGGDPQSGKALHVKLKPLDRSKVDLWEFHLTNEKKHAASLAPTYYPNFNLMEFKSGKCTIYATLDVFDSDRGRFYYASPGAIIDSNSARKNSRNNPCLSISTCVDDYLDVKEGECTVLFNNNKKADGTIDTNKCGAKDMCVHRPPSGAISNCAGPSHYTICGIAGPAHDPDYCEEKPSGITKRVIDIEFTNLFNTNDPDNCLKDSCCKQQPSACNLLKRADSNPTEFEYIVKYGIICTNKKESCAGDVPCWKPCTSKLGQDSTYREEVNVGGTIKCFKCDWRDDTGIGQWIETSCSV